MSTEAEPEERRKAKKDRWIGRTLVEKYRLDARIGEGAMGRVYRAWHLPLERPVAIKVLHRHLSGDDRLAKRFHREAQAASRLSHPNSLQIIDFGEAEDGALFIVMELLDGDDLQAVIDTDAPLTPARIGRLMVQALSALDEAHHAGIIHRDFKPENVVVIEGRSGERVKVCDFGIAKIVEDEGRVTAITKDGYVCGTPEYIAPEQARGEVIDARVDVYSAGVMLYQLLCGEVPFKAESALGIITKHVTEAPRRPRNVRPSWGIPRALERVALKALSKKPVDRYGSAAEMSRAIEGAISSLGDLADTRLGDGAFAGDSDDAEADDHEEEGLAHANTEDAIAKVVPRRDGWKYALAGALALVALAIAFWGRRSAEPESAPPVAAAPEAAALEGAASQGPPSETPPELIATTEAPTPPREPIAPSEAEPPPELPALSRRRRPRRSPAAPEVAPAPSAYEDGRQRMLRGDLPGALRQLRRAARETPRDPRVHKELGRVHMRAGDVNAGIAAYQRYLTLAPRAPDRAIVERIIAQHGG